MKTTLRGPKGLTVEMDTDQIVPHDPGMGTPVLVCFLNGDTGTWNCVRDNGETCDGTRLSQAQNRWLDRIAPEVEAWMEKNGA